ncbi:MAG: cupin [Parasphingorhabdus sp.]
MNMAHRLEKNPIHLGLGATAEVEPHMTGGMEWYEGYGARHGHDGAEGRLVSMHTFTESWDVWEMHPKGAEVVLCTTGEITLVQEMADGSHQRTTLSSGEYAVNAPGVWHTADVEGSATAVFITAGEGTEHRER